MRTHGAAGRAAAAEFVEELVEAAMAAAKKMRGGSTFPAYKPVRGFAPTRKAETATAGAGS